MKFGDGPPEDEPVATPAEGEAALEGDFSAPDVSRQALDDTPEKPVPAAASAAPAANNEAVQKLQRAMIRMASARTEAERVAAQEELRIAANLTDAPKATEQFDETDREAMTLEAELLGMAELGETTEDRKRNLSHYEKVVKLQLAKAAKGQTAAAQRVAIDTFKALFEELGVTPDDFKHMAKQARSAEWEPAIAKLGPDSRQLVDDATELRRKAAAVGEELDHETAMLFAARKKGKAKQAAAAPQTTQRTPVPSDEREGPPARQTAKPNGRALTGAEIIADFHAKQRSNGAGQKLLPGFASGRFSA